MAQQTAETPETKLAEHLAAIVGELGELMKQQVASAKEELKAEGRRKVRAGMALGMAAALAHAGLLYLLLVGVALWTYLFQFWAAALIMALVAFAAAGAAALTGWHELRQPSFEDTKKNLELDERVLKEAARTVREEATAPVTHS